MYINMLNRLRLLDCDDEEIDRKGIPYNTKVCHKCVKKQLAKKQEGLDTSGMGMAAAASSASTLDQEDNLSDVSFESGRIQI